ncbi:MAG: Uma2 family endonuclease [Pirellulaceae bacterium]
MFGHLRAARLRTDPPPGQATEQDVIDLHDRHDGLYELYRGVLLEKAMGFYESYLALLLGRYLTEFVQKHDLEIVTGADGMLKLSPGEVRIPDLCFVSWSRLGGRRIPREPVPLLVPDLAVEVISRGNTAEEIQRKLADYFQAGVQRVWYVYPDRRLVEVFTSPDSRTELSEHDTLEGGDVLPGFQLPLARLFEDPPHPRP